MKFAKILLLGLAVLLTVACKKEGDRTSPTAEITTPEIGAKYYRGRTITLNAVFKDDESGLKECTIDLVSLKSAKGWDDPWVPEAEIIPLSGLERTVSNHIVFNGEIPMDIMSGSYIMKFRVYDQEGNMAEYSREIVVD